jgi:hypothetical protein
MRSATYDADFGKSPGYPLLESFPKVIPCHHGLPRKVWQRLSGAITAGQT